MFSPFGPPGRFMGGGRWGGSGFLSLVSLVSLVSIVMPACKQRKRVSDAAKGEMMLTMTQCQRGCTVGNGDGIALLYVSPKVRRNGFWGNTYKHVLNCRGRRAILVSHFVCRRVEIWDQYLILALILILCWIKKRVVGKRPRRR